MAAWTSTECGLGSEQGETRAGEARPENLPAVDDPSSKSKAIDLPA